MSEAISPSTGRRYGIQRVCRVLGCARSTFYASSAEAGSAVAERPSKRGPRPRIADEDLLERIREDLEKSPFQGEGHRKVWARLRRAGVRVGRKRVLRLMRKSNLLSPNRAPRGEQHLHDGRITTDEPNEMWGTDGTRVFTLEDGWAWIFAVVEHWNTECVGSHVCKHGTRYEALQPLSMAISKVFGSIGPEAARGLKLRMDHGSQFRSEHYRKQIKFWGVAPSFAFVEEPETNGVAERFLRTLKEQAIYGRVFRNIDELRQAVNAFVAKYNESWLVEKLGFKSPAEARAEKRLLATSAA
jgi:transposase InsO family protein